jgi:pSer/pThr/pTyr-binding forkhead associated (FHA) protein
MRLILAIISGPLADKELVIETGQSLKVGRTTKADVAIQDGFLSGVHFVVECDGRACRLRDLQSRNGTKLNGKPVTEAELVPGDRIRAGQSEFVVSIEAVPAPTKNDQLAETIPPSEPLPELLPGQGRPGSVEALADAIDAAVTGRAAKTPSPQGLPATGRQRTDTPERQQASRGPAQASTPQFDQAITAYQEATLEGQLLRILRNQPMTLMALLDATHERRVLELLRDSGEEYRSLYKDDANATIAPYLVKLPPQSQLLQRMVHEGWGRNWGVYLTCGVSLAELREYYRRALMVSTPDGIEMFSRFYDPRFFRHFLETCTSIEADRFFGPIGSYLVEAEKREILLQFKRTNRGVEKRGHPLSVLD